MKNLNFIRQLIIIVKSDKTVHICLLERIIKMLKYFPTGIHFVTTGVYAGLLKASSGPRDRRPFHHSFGHNYYVKVAVTGEAYYIYMYTPHNFL